MGATNTKPAVRALVRHERVPTLPDSQGDMFWSDAVHGDSAWVAADDSSNKRGSSQMRGVLPQRLRKVGGIYAIRHVGSGRCYVGSAVSIRSRWGGHRTCLRAGTHRNGRLQNAWKKYGERSFEFFILELVGEKAHLLVREQYWIDRLNPFYNICRVAGSPLGVKHSEETKRKIGNLKRGSRHSEHTKRLMSSAHRGRPPCAEAVAASVLRNKGRKRTPEENAAVSAGVKRWYERKPEIRKKLSERAKQLWKEPGMRERILAKRRETPANPEHRERARRLMLAILERKRAKKACRMDLHAVAQGAVGAVVCGFGLAQEGGR